MKTKLIFQTLLSVLLVPPFNSVFAMQIKPHNRESAYAVIKQYLPNNPIILEAGACRGEDSVWMANYWKQAVIYTFEPDPDNFIILRNNTKGIKNIYISPLALSDKNGTALFHQSQDPKNHKYDGQSGSLFKPKEHLNHSHVTFPTTVEVKTITLDTWAQQNNVRKIDFMWLDMQGAELHALMAGKELLKTVQVIYTEVELVEAYEGQYLYKDVRAWLEGQGFTLVAKDFYDNDSKQWFGNIVMARINN